MNIVRAPLRISLGGGGTDIPGWYIENGGFLISAAINKYIYLTGSRRNFDNKLWLSYSQVEICDSVDQITHKIFAQCLEKYDISRGIEIHSISELPGGSGLGSSGTFTVSLLRLLNIMQRRDMTMKELAEFAASIEMVELGRSCGKQDQYIAVYGGVITLDISKNGDVNVEVLDLDSITLKGLNSNLLLYYTGVSRDANMILAEQNDLLRKRKLSPTAGMKRIQEIGYKSKEELLSGNLDEFGRLLDEHWEVKKSMSKKMSNQNIDNLYYYAKECGALGGKVVGAGGGGYFMFYVPPALHLSFRKKMVGKGLSELNWDFDFQGVTKIFSG